MKEKFLSFLKKNWIILTAMLVTILLFILSVVSMYFLVAGCLVLAVLCFVFFAKFRAKYIEIKNVDPKKDYFDARKIDYDEDVYYVGDGEKKTKMKRSFAQYYTLLPMVFFAIVGIMCCSFAVTLLLRYLI